MYRLRAGTIELPRIYVAESAADAKVCIAHGIPFIRKTKSMTDRDIICYALLPSLRKKFPDVKWNKVLGINKYKNIYVKTPPDTTDVVTGGEVQNGDEYADYSEDERTFTGGKEDDWYERPLDKYVGDVSSSVNIEQLQDLNLLPAFLDDIVNNITKNVYGQKVWCEGYTKKLGAVLGNFDQDYEKGNLIILDISGSIPRGVSSTMLTLLPTLRERCNADCIVTGSKSIWIPRGKDVEPQLIRNKIGYGNESRDFVHILNEHVFHKKWGNIIVFGDEDRPVKFRETEDYEGYEYGSSDRHLIKYMDSVDWSDTSVEKLWSYHTRRDRTPGYAKWVEELFDYKVPNTYNHEWCEIMEM